MRMKNKRQGASDVVFILRWRCCGRVLLASGKRVCDSGDGCRPSSLTCCRFSFLPRRRSICARRRRTLLRHPLRPSIHSGPLVVAGHGDRFSCSISFVFADVSPSFPEVSCVRVVVSSPVSHFLSPSPSPSAPAMAESCSGEAGQMESRA